MPDSTIYSNANDGVIYYNHVLAAGARNNATGTVTDGDNTYEVGIDRIPAGRGANYTYKRAYFFFLLTGESGTVDSAELKVHQAGDGTEQFYAVEWDSSATSLASGDYDSVLTTGIDMTPYSVGITSSGSSAYDTYPMNSDGISAIQSAVGSGIFRVAIVTRKDFDASLVISQDYLETMTFANSGLNKPKLEITYESGVTYNSPFLGANF